MISKIDEATVDFLREKFRYAQPSVMGTFGGSEYLFRRWWRDVTKSDPADESFIKNYSTNDRFLKNRLILPEEIPFFTLPLLKVALRSGYSRVCFLERGAYPYFVAMCRLVEELRLPDVPSELIRVRGLGRERLSTNLLTVAARDQRDLDFLNGPISDSEHQQIHQSIEREAAERIDRFCSRAHSVLLLADIGIDPRVRIPNVLKSVLFEAGDRMMSGSLSGEDLLADLDPKVLGVAPEGEQCAVAMIRSATDKNGKLSLPPMLDWMHRYVSELRRSVRHTSRSALNISLRGTNAASTFGPGRIFVCRRNRGLGQYVYSSGTSRTGIPTELHPGVRVGCGHMGQGMLLRCRVGKPVQVQATGRFALPVCQLLLSGVDHLRNGMRSASSVPKLRSGDIKALVVAGHQLQRVPFAHWNPLSIWVNGC
jgi:hypothetical protein